MKNIFITLFILLSFNLLSQTDVGFSGMYVDTLTREVFVGDLTENKPIGYISLTDGAKRTVNDFGAIPNDGIDDTVPIQNAIDNETIVNFEEGQYIVSSLEIPKNKRLIGNNCTIVQAIGTVDGTRIINVNGGNTRVSDFNIIGQISSNGSEQNHGVFVFADTENIKNVVIENIKGNNLRGDIIYIGGKEELGLTPDNISVNNITGSNILRNAVSVTNGYNINISNIKVDSVGFMQVDLESDGIRNIKNVCLENIWGASVGIISTNENAVVENITLKNINLNENRKVTNPVYLAGQNGTSGIIIRNAKNVKTENLTIDSMSHYAVEIISETLQNDSLSKEISIDGFDIRNCLLNETQGRNTYFLFSGKVKGFELRNGFAKTNTGNIFLHGTSSVFSKHANVSVENVRFEGDYFARNCNIVARNCDIISSDICVQSIAERSTFYDCSFKGNRLLSNLEVGTSFYNCNFDFTTSKVVNGSSPLEVNCRTNGTLLVGANQGTW